MKILTAGDIHGEAGLAKDLARKARKDNVDLVILCGDVTYFDTRHENIIGPFRKEGLRVLIVPGNHESTATADFLAEVYDIKNIHGYSVKYEDIGIFGAGGCTEVGPSPPIDNDEMFDLLEKGFERIKYLPKKIMVTHEHPADSTMEKFTRFFPGSKAIRKAVEKFKPDFLLCSHVHEAEGIEEKIGSTTVINVGKQGRILEF